MNNALGDAQTIVLFGGTSDIGRAIVDALVSPATLITRPPTVRIH